MKRDDIKPTHLGKLNFRKDEMKEAIKKGCLGDVSPLEWIKAFAQWMGQGLILIPVWILAVFPMGILVAIVTKPMMNIFGEFSKEHEQKYIDKGSSGVWYYTGTNIPIIKWWSNLEDGQLGEDTGRWSASKKGKENTFLNKWLWSIRNPFNYYKRTSKFMSCIVDNCTISYYGLSSVSDKDPSGNSGGYLCIAKDVYTGRKYYGFRYVCYWDRVTWFKGLVNFLSTKAPKLSKWLSNRCLNASLGFKVKPTHAGNPQDADDQDKASTLRIQFFSKVN